MKISIYLAREAVFELVQELRLVTDAVELGSFGTRTGGLS